MSTASRLESAELTVIDSSIQLKAHFAANPPDRTSKAAAEALLRAWGEFRSEEMIYFAALQEPGRYTLSLVTDPGRWTPEEFPALQIVREPAAGGEAARFRVTAAVKDAGPVTGRLRSALEALVSAEQGKKASAKIEPAAPTGGSPADSGASVLDVIVVPGN